jgi:hypothetical protein
LFDTEPKFQRGISHSKETETCPSDLAAYMRILESPTTAEARLGVLRDTVKVFVLDNELEV